MYHLKNRWIGGALIIGGTTIGGGMLALPVNTGLSGLIPTLCLLIAYWAFMTFTAFLMLEANLWMGKDANLISMAHSTLGRWGEALSWITYLFLLYALTMVYFAGSSPIFLDGMEWIFGTRPPDWVGPLPLLLIFGTIVYLGTEAVDWINRFLMAGLIVTFAAIIVFLAPKANPSYYTHIDWSTFLFGFSIVSVSFGYQIVIPSLRAYMEGDVAQMKKAIWVGSLIPLSFYLVWVIVTLGIVPLEGPCGLVKGFKEGNDVVHLIVSCLQNRGLQFIVWIMGFFALLTSFLGVSLSLSDFLSDGLKIRKHGYGNVVLYFLTFAPPLFFMYIDPRAFLNGLEYVGGFGVTILLALLPALMVWAGRYKKKFEGPFTTWGGKTGLIFTILGSFFVMGVELARRVGLLTFHGG